jgi:hypothetical protein
MMPSCPSPLELDTLLAYWLGELDEAAEARAEEHLFGCASCSGHLDELVALDRETRQLTHAGAVRAVVNDDFARRLVERGAQVREYRLPHNGSANCTVAPEDDIVIARLEAPLRGVARLDLVELDSAGKRLTRIEDIPFRPGNHGVVIIPRIGDLRALPAMTMRMRLLAVDEAGERVIGEYTFNHTPHGTAG